MKLFERAIVIIIVIFITAGIVFASGNLINKKTGESLQDGCAADMVFVPSAEGGFCIDRYEASAGGDCPFNNPDTQDKTRVNLGFEACIPDSRKSAEPWRNISQNQAALACAKAGKRLATNLEWMTASLSTPDEGENWSGDDCQLNNNWENQPGLTGSGVDCASSNGAYDMIGNVWEWVSDTIYNGDYKNRILPESGYVLSVGDDGMPGEVSIEEGDANYYYDYFWINNKELRGIARGGYWNSGADGGRYSVYAVAKPSFSGVGIGFRCVK